MPSSRAPYTFTVRLPGRAPRYFVTTDNLTDALTRYYGAEMPISRDELKAKRLAAMGAVAAEMDASADMYDRVVAARQTVQRARDTAENVHMNAMAAQVADLREMASEMAEFAQAVPKSGGNDGQKLPPDTKQPVTGSDALKVLQATQPGSMNFGDAYAGTHPPGTEGPK